MTNRQSPRQQLLPKKPRDGPPTHAATAHQAGGARLEESEMKLYDVKRDEREFPHRCDMRIDAEKAQRWYSVTAPKFPTEGVKVVVSPDAVKACTRICFVILHKNVFC